MRIDAAREPSGLGEFVATLSVRLSDFAHCCHLFDRQFAGRKHVLIGIPPTGEPAGILLAFRRFVITKSAGRVDGIRLLARVRESDPGFRSRKGVRTSRCWRFSAATSMIIVAAIAVSTVVSNHIVIPVALRLLTVGHVVGGDVRSLILLVR